MAAETLDRLAKIVESLGPLGDAGPGEPVRASEWNELVGAVQELARICVAREEATQEVLASKFALADHRHEGEVGLTWFDPQTRALVEGEGKGRADITSEIGRLRRDLTTLSGTVSRLETQLKGLQLDVDEVDTKARDGIKLTDRVAARVELLNENTSSLAELRSTFGAIDTRVGEALALRDELIDPAGDRINLATLRDNVSELQKIKENLTAADGRLVEYRDFERRLAQVETAEGGESGPILNTEVLKQEVLAAAGVLIDGKIGPISESVGTNAGKLDEFTTRLGKAESAVTLQAGQITAVQNATAAIPSLSQRIGGVETRVAGHDVRFTVMEPLVVRMDRVETEISAIPMLDSRLKSAEDGLAEAKPLLATVPQLDSRIGKVESFNPEQLSQRLGTLEMDTSEIRGSITTSKQRLETLESRADSSDSRFNKVETQSAANRQEIQMMQVRDTGIRNQPSTTIVRPIRPIGPQ